MKNTGKALEISTILPNSQADKIQIIEALLAEKDSEISEQNSKILSLENEVRWFKEQFKLAQQRQFGRSTETLEALQVE